MPPRWERTTVAPEFEGALLLDAVLRPHRSLSRYAFRLMLAGVVAINVGVALVFLLRGAAPVAAFLGADVLALWLAFHLNYRAGRAQQRVRIAPGQVHVASVDPSGAVAHWVLNPVWARVLREGKGVIVRAGRGQMRLGAFLSPDECEEFAAALDVALYKAKRGP